VAGSDGVAVAGSDESVGSGLAASSVGDGLASSVGDGLASSVGDGVAESVDESVGVAESVLEANAALEVAEAVADAESVLEDTGALDVAETAVEAADDDETVAEALDSIALAWDGVIVKVDVPLAVAPELPPDEPEPRRTICPRTSCWESIKAIVGPATSWVVARSRTLLSKG